MATRAWYVDIDGTKHYVELDHGTFSGKRTIRVDDDVVYTKGMGWRFGDKIRFSVAGHPAELEINEFGFVSDYVLKVDNRVVPRI